MNRRRFLEQLSTLMLGLAASSAVGCQPLAPSKSRGAGNRGTSTSGRSETTPAAPRPSPRPDLAVIRGADLERNVRSAVEKLGGIERFVKKGNKVVVKPNLTIPRRPEYAVTTNPGVVGALVKLCVDAGASSVTVMDNGGSTQEEAFTMSKIGWAVKAAGGTIKILEDRDFEEMDIPRGHLLRRWPLLRDIFEADVFINVPIAKHHNLAILTMAMKNLMGTMGGDRSVMHRDFPQRIVDLNTLVRPDLVVLDAHRILVRNGPLGGSLADVRKLNTVVAGTNQASIDAYGATLFGMIPTRLPYLVNAYRRGLGEINLRKLSILRQHA